ncbi:Bifunctional aspartokinase/homoserine dehydrogenase protein, partial [Thalictrum thalictroides]
MSSEPVAKDNEDFYIINNAALVNVKRTGVSGLPSTTSVISGIMEGLGVEVLLLSQDISKGTVCFAVHEKEVDAIAEALESRFQKESIDGCHSKVEVIPNCSILAAVDQKGANSPGVGVSFITALAK